MFLGNFGEYSDVIPASGEILGPPLFGGLGVAAVFSHPDRIQVGLQQWSSVFLLLLMLLQGSCHYVSSNLGISWGGLWVILVIFNLLSVFSFSPFPLLLDWCSYDGSYHGGLNPLMALFNDLPWPLLCSTVGSSPLLGGWLYVLLWPMGMVRYLNVFVSSLYSFAFANATYSG